MQSRQDTDCLGFFFHSGPRMCILPAVAQIGCLELSITLAILGVHTFCANDACSPFHYPATHHCSLRLHVLTTYYSYHLLLWCRLLTEPYDSSIDEMKNGKLTHTIQLSDLVAQQFLRLVKLMRSYCTCSGLEVEIYDHDALGNDCVTRTCGRGRGA